MLSNSDSKKLSKWTSVNSKIFKMYRDSFNRVIPGSLKEIEFQSFRRSEKLSTYKSSPVPGKSLKVTEFSKNHVNLASGTKIVELPMSPFGKHTSYNNETEFKSKHFLNSTSTENRALEKQIKLLRKRINSNLKNSVVKKGYFRANQFMNVFKTNGGSLYSSVIKDRYLKTERSASEEDRKSTSMNSSTVKDLRSFGKISPIRELRECN